ncbi:MAG TPA: ATP-dependent Clp protease proteolytic subunit, partial [Egibacteraceae bacterium]|nr:ATP-dependent Clp protease proteolytic subunit [Egibacteraceae bacterium]
RHSPAADLARAPRAAEGDHPLATLLEADAFKKLYDNRILYLRGPIEDTVADTLVAQMMALDAESDKDVTLYINSPGGLVSGMFAVYDVMHLMNAKVNTVCVGVAASAAAFLLATGTGVRAATPNARVMIHQPLGGARGQAVDIQIQAKQIVYLRERLYEILAERTGQDLERIRRDADRDFWLGAEEAKEYGVIDEIRSRGGI